MCNSVGFEYNKKLNFIEIEKKLIEKKEKILEKQWNEEMKYYNKLNSIKKKDFEIISNEVFKILIETKNFSKEKKTITNFIDFNKKLLNEITNKECYISYSAEIITNWILLSLNTNFIDRSYFKNKKIYSNNYDVVNKLYYLYKMYITFFNFKNNLCVKNIFNNKEKKNVKHIIFYIINLLINKNILKKLNFKINSKKYKYKKKFIKTHSFLYLENNNNIDNNILNFNIFFEKPKIHEINNKYYLGGIHYYSFSKIFKNNPRSNESLKFNNNNIVKKICSLKYQIDFSFYKKILDLICKSLNINNSETDLNNYIINNLDKIYNEDIFNANNNYITTENNKKIIKTEENIENEKIIFQQEYSKILLYYLFYKVGTELRNKNEFYLAVDFDFRGRLYPKSCISPTGNKIFRYLYYYGYYSEEELKKIDKKYFNKLMIDIIKKCNLFKIYNNIDLENNINLTYCYWSLFEIGKIFKNELSSKLNGVFNDIDLIKFGSEIFEKINSKTLNMSFDEELQYIYIISCIEDLNNGLYKKLIIYKDATASGIQLLTTILGANNQEILKNCNLNSNNVWYDTYSYVINLFIKKHNNELKNITNNNYNKYLKRSFLKKSIMTYVYGASKETALYYYLENLSSDLDKKITKEIFFMFYDFLNTLFFSTNFFNEPPINIINNAKKEYKINKKIYLKTTDNALIPLTYYKINYYRLDRIIENNRSTISFYSKSSTFDKVKTYRALLANVTQSLDALFLRLIILKMGKYIITVHDSFGIDILNIDKLIKVANIAINKIYFDFNINVNIKNKNKNKKFFSVFILI